MDSKLSKMLFRIPIALLSAIVVIAFSGCADKKIELYPGTWSATNVKLSEELSVQTFSVTVKYVGGNYYDHADEELAVGYIFINDEAYSLTFNIDGEDVVSASSTYYGKELHGSGGSWRGYKFNFAGKLMRSDGSDYFDGSISVLNANGERVGDASVSLKKIAD